MPEVLAAKPNATQNSPFLSQQWPKPSQYSLHLHRGMARLSGPEWPEKYQNSRRRPAKGGQQSQ